MNKATLKDLIKECLRESQMSDLGLKIDEFINGLAQENNVSPEEMRKLVASYFEDMYI